MSASERLKALLDAAAKEEAGIVPVHPEDLGYVQFNKAQAALEDAIADALPQIVALVEAAELLAPIASLATRQAGINRTPVTKMEAALAVLEEALGGDVT